MKPCFTLGTLCGQLRSRLRVPTRTPAAQGEPPEHEFLVDDRRRVRRLLCDLASSRRLLSLLGQEVGYAARARLLVDDIESPRLAMQLLDGVAMPSCMVNVTTAGDRGLVMFTLEQFETSTSGLISAAWPRHVLNMQSRRHYRVVGLNAAGRRAELALVCPTAAAAPSFALRDISEEGVGFELLQGQVLPAQARLDGAFLHLDGQTLRVPWIEVVHRRRGAGVVAVVGARLLGMSAEDLRRLRRWITDRQASAVALAGGAVA